MRVSCTVPVRSRQSHHRVWRVSMLRRLGMSLRSESLSLAAVLAGVPLSSLSFCCGMVSAMGQHDNVVIAVAIAIVTVGASWSAAYAVAKVGSAAMGAVSENPELMGRSLVFVGLAEGIAIYGLIIAIMLLQKMG